MRRYNLRYVHKVAPKDTDAVVADLRDGCFSDSKTLAKELRAKGLLLSGVRIREMRVEGDKCVIFPVCPGLTTYWHSVIITPVVSVSADVRRAYRAHIYLGLWLGACQRYHEPSWGNGSMPYSPMPANYPAWRETECLLPCVSGSDVFGRIT